MPDLPWRVDTPGPAATGRSILEVVKTTLEAGIGRPFYSPFPGTLENSLQHPVGSLQRPVDSLQNQLFASIGLPAYVSLHGSAASRIYDALRADGPQTSWGWNLGHHAEQHKPMGSR